MGSVGAAALAQLTNYLKALCRSSRNDSWDVAAVFRQGEYRVVGLAASAFHAVVTVNLLPQRAAAATEAATVCQGVRS